MILKGLSKTAGAVVDPLKLNAIIERSRQGRRVFVKERHRHGEGMADLANIYFHALRIPIRFLNNVTAWQLWELKCFNMLNGDRFRAIASGRRKVILDKLPGKSLWCYLKQGRATLPAVKAAGLVAGLEDLFFPRRLWRVDIRPSSNGILGLREQKFRLKTEWITPRLICRLH